MRKDFAPSEEVAICEAIEPLEEKQAKERQERKPISGGKLPPQKKGKSRDKVAKYVGKSAKTMKKAKAAPVLGGGTNCPRHTEENPLAKPFFF